MIGIDFQITTDASSADLTFIKNDDADSLGTAAWRYTLPGGSDTAIGSADIRIDDVQSDWNVTNVKGSEGYETLVHEIGHALGLGHPHDDGHESLLLRGLSYDTRFTSGTNGLNEAIHTIMAYRTGWQAENTSDVTHGAQGTFAPWDIAALQQVYGAVDNATGNNTYTLPTTEGAGTFFETIWDTGGVDKISAEGHGKSAIIDLRPASLDYDAETGGGPVSHHVESTGTVVPGGFNIAAGSRIENAVGSNVSDVLIGNAGDNVLVGKGGYDNLRGGSGDDTLGGGGGEDFAIFSGLRSAYEITTVSNNQFRVVDQRGTDGTDDLFGVEFAKFKDGIVELGQSAPIDFVFLQDLSGSFGNDLPNVQDAARGIVDVVQSINPDSEFATAGFVGEALTSPAGKDVYDYRAYLSTTSSGDTLVNSIGGLNITSGVDIGESQLRALTLAAQGRNLDYRSDTQRYVLLSTDETYTDDSDRPSISTVRSALEANNVTPIFAATSSVYSVYEDLVEQLGRGAVVTLTSNSDNLADSVRLALAKVSSSSTRSDFGSSSNDNLSGDRLFLDELFGLGGDDNLAGYGGDDVLDGGAGNDTVVGHEGSDTLRGGSGNDRLRGGTGDDYIDGGSGGDEIFGDRGRDTLSYAASSSGVGVDLSDGSTAGGHAAGDTVTGIEDLIGSALSDVLRGTDAVNELIGSGGDDLLRGRGSGDVLNGGDGSDTVDYRDSPDAVDIALFSGVTSGGDAENDQLISIENVVGSAYDDRLAGTSGDNTFDGGAGADTLGGGPGEDTASYARSPVGVDVLLFSNYATGGHATGDVLRSIEHLTGSPEDDVLAGNENDNTLHGGDGADVLIGGEGRDTATYTGSYGVRVSLAERTASYSDAYGDRLLQIENLVGSDRGDTLIGDANDNVLTGAGGSDSLDGREGTDTVSYAGSGSAVTIKLFDGTAEGGHAAGDSIANFENVIGSDFDDVLVGGLGDNVLRGGAGRDRLSGGPGSDTASYVGAAAAVTALLWKGTGEAGEAEGDTYNGILNLIGSSHNDRLIGDAGDNVLQGGDGGDELNGSSGTDTASYADAEGAVTIRLWRGTGEGSAADGDRLTGIENLVGSEHNDVLVGDTGDNVLHGGQGADQLTGSTGTDTASYADGAEGVAIRLWSGTGDAGAAAGDRYSGIENLTGTPFADTLVGDAGDNVIEGGAGGDRISGGPGTDTASYAGSDAAVTVKLFDGTASGGHAAGDSLSTVENLIGSRFDDTLVGDAGDNVLNGGLGADQMSGGPGTDAVSYAGASAGVTVKLWEDAGERGEATGDTFNAIENLIGSAENDILVGDAGDNVLEGGGGRDRLVGGPGEDTASYAGSDAGVTVKLFDGSGDGGHATGDSLDSIEHLTGSAYNDKLVGSSGSNTLYGAGGNDVLSGGSGNDVFIFAPGDGHDRVVNWRDGSYELDLTAFAFGDFTDVSGLASNVSSGLHLDFGDGDKVTITGLSTSGFDSDDVAL